MTPSALDLAYRQRRFWHFYRMRMLRKNDTIYRNYDLLARFNEGDSAADFKWAGFRNAGEPVKTAMRRLQYNIWLKYHWHITDVALMSLMREYVIWERIHQNDMRSWPTRSAAAIKALHDENERAKR